MSPGHTLLVPKRHASSFFDLSEQERSDLFSLLDRTKLALDEEFQPQGYNIGINDGAAAGQTVLHLHVHLIPAMTVIDPTREVGCGGSYLTRRNTGHDAQRSYRGVQHHSCMAKR